MSTGPFLVGLVVSTVNVAFLLRHIKYRTELATYGYLEGNQPFQTTTPFTDCKDYRLEMWHRIRKHENSTAGDLAVYSHTVTTSIRDAVQKLFNMKAPWSKE